MAGLVAGTVLVPLATAWLMSSSTFMTTAAVFVVLASLVLARAGISLPTVVFAWASAVATFTVTFLVADTGLGTTYVAPGVLVVVILGSLAVAPWLAILGVVRHFLTPPESRPSYDLKDLHS